MVHRPGHQRGQPGPGRQAPQQGFARRRQEAQFGPQGQVAIEDARADGLGHALAVTGGKRSPYAPEMPTMAESGFPGFEATTWYGLVGPGTLPAAMAKRMNEDVNKVLAMPDVKEKMEKLGGEVAQPMSLSDMSKLIASDTDKWAGVIKAGNIKLD